MIEIAERIARIAHKEQTDKNGESYINHPLAVADMVVGEDAKCVALLHDVLEDSSFTVDDLLALGIPPHIVDAVECLTRRGNETYVEYIDRVRANPLSREVKLADLTHNLDPARSGGLPDSLRKRYMKACRVLAGKVFVLPTRT